jgi:hypothetical protein
VVTRLPSSSPVAARKNAPLQTEPYRRVAGATWRSQFVTAGAGDISAAFGHPATERVDWFAGRGANGQVRHEPRAGGTANLTGRARDDKQAIFLPSRLHIRLCEHVQRARNVQELNTRQS